MRTVSDHSVENNWWRNFLKTLLKGLLITNCYCCSLWAVRSCNVCVLFPFQTLPMTQAPASIPQMELPDSGLTYLPWGQPLTTISTLPTPGVQFTPNSAPLPGSPLVHMPLSMSLTTVIPQSVDPHPQMVELQQNSEHQLDPEPQGHSLDEDDVRDTESPNLLDKLLEEQKDHVHEEDKDSYNSAVFIPNLWKEELCPPFCYNLLHLHLLLMTYDF